jgi:hypothetical protein
MSYRHVKAGSTSEIGSSSSRVWGCHSRGCGILRRVDASVLPPVHTARYVSTIFRLRGLMQNVISHQPCAFRRSEQWSSTWGTRNPGSTRKHFTSIKTKHRNRLNLEPALILALNEGSSPNWGAGMSETSSIIPLTRQNNINTCNW